jgi:hypothetical protein
MELISYLEYDRRQSGQTKFSPKFLSLPTSSSCPSFFGSDLKSFSSSSCYPCIYPSSTMSFEEDLDSSEGLKERSWYSASWICWANSSFRSELFLICSLIFSYTCLITDEDGDCYLFWPCFHLWFGFSNVISDKLEVIRCDAILWNGFRF